jgi:hypothetical protein
MRGEEGPVIELMDDCLLEDMESGMETRSKSKSFDLGTSWITNHISLRSNAGADALKALAEFLSPSSIP